MITLKDIDDSIKEFYVKNGRTPKLVEFTVKNGFPCNKETLLKRFGKYNGILDKLGYETFSHGERRYNNEKLLNDLKNAIVKYRTSNYDIIRKDENVVYREIYRRIFGSYFEAVKLSGITRNNLYMLEMFANYNLENEKEFLIKNLYGGKLTDKHIELLEKAKEIPDEEFNRDNVSKKISIATIYKLFNNFSLFCIMADKTVKSIFKRQHVADDGHVCDSFEECYLDNFLSKNNIIHNTQVKYPNSKMTSDFEINGKFVEYTKFKQSHITDKYNETLVKKRKICKENNIELIEIDDISDEKLQELLRRL